MKYFKYWVKEAFQIRINGDLKTISILSGSNESKEDAHTEATTKAHQIEERIKNRSQKEKYEVAIREHVDQIIDETNIISICRYGAKILNTTQYTILDLDDYRFSFFDLFGRLKKLSKKERIIYKFERNVTRFPELGRDFRIYETNKGIRVIGKQYVTPAGKYYTAMMRKLSVDGIYVQLSKKQNCYRARLTPKPYRMKSATIKIRCPLDCETSAYYDWSNTYEAASKNFSVVKLAKINGMDFSQEPIVKLHDEICNMRKQNKLA